MKFWIGGEVENDVYDDFRVIRNSIEITINEILELQSIEEYEKVRVLIVIRELNEGLNRGAYNKRKRIFEIEKSIDYFAFKNSNAKRELVIDAITTSLVLLPMDLQMNLIRLFKSIK